MESLPILASAIFIGAVFLVITGWIDSVIAALLGVIVMVGCGVMSEVEAFRSVDWNVILILLSIWIISGYFGKTGVPEFLALVGLRISKGNLALFVTSVGVFAGFVSMLVDNVVVVLMFAPVIFQVSRRFSLASFEPLMFTALCANFMGTALLLGDLPPQMLHSVAGAEFLDFIWFMSRPSSFLVLLISYILTSAFFFAFFSKRYKGRLLAIDAENERPVDQIKDKTFALIVCSVFALTIVGMALRRMLGFQLGFIAMMGATLLVLIFELFKGRFSHIQTFENVLSELDWRAIFFYISLFALVSALDHSGVIKMIAHSLVPLISHNLLAGCTALYWVTAPIVGIVEHDAYILTMLYVIRDIGRATALNPWPLYWMLLWAGTLGSNLTIAGAPALFVAKNLSEKEDKRSVSLSEFLSMSVPFVIVSLITCFVPAVLIWVLPFAK